ncbi:MAG: FprA family A-type flavoprotein [Caldisericia bacterium]|nr:FprA family A-type flavoprotein [Caldisericia bacterium]
MSFSRCIGSSVYAVGALDWNRRLFDELIPLPDGTSYNAYLIQGSEKTVLIDSVDPACYHQLKTNLQALSIERIDYIISQHAEQDHSGSIPFLLQAFPMAKVVTNPKCKDLLMAFHHLPESVFITIQTNETLSLGNKTLQFFFTPWVHWPDTMCTYLQEDRILFTCDLFGSHIASSELFSHDPCKLLSAGRRYYAEIMMPFRSVISSNLNQLSSLPFDMIAPSHGPVQSDKSVLWNAYLEWISDKVHNKVVLPYVSMHESTKLMVDHLVNRLVQKNVAVDVFDLPKTDIGELASSIVDAATVILGTPFVLAGAHPVAAYAAYLVNALRPKIKWFGIIGSFGWGGKMTDQITSLLGNMKSVKILEPVLEKGTPNNLTFQKLDALAEEIAAYHSQNIESL